MTFDPILKPCRFSGMKEALGLTAESKVMLVSKNCFKISQLEWLPKYVNCFKRFQDIFFETQVSTESDTDPDGFMESIWGLTR